MAKCYLLPLFLAFLLPAASDACHPDDLRALQGFAANLRGGGAVLLRTAWSGASCCAWEGVGCDAATGRVTTLSLPGRGLAGPILGASLADCRELKSLNLANKRQVVSIPSGIGEFDDLCYLVLSDNSLVGEVPKILIQLKGLAALGGSRGMAFSNTPLDVKRNRRILQEQPNSITGSNNTVRSGSNNVLRGNDNTVVSGNSNNVSGSNNTVVTGNGNTVTGSHNTVSGSNNTVSGSNHVVSGDNQVVTDG